MAYLRSVPGDQALSEEKEKAPVRICPAKAGGFFFLLIISF